MKKLISLHDRRFRFARARGVHRYCVFYRRRGRSAFIGMVWRSKDGTGWSGKYPNKEYESFESKNTRLEAAEQLAKEWRKKKL